MRDIVDCEHSLTRRIPLKKKRQQRNKAYAHHQVQIEAIFKGNLLCSFPAIKKKKRSLTSTFNIQNNLLKKKSYTGPWWTQIILWMKQTVLTPSPSLETNYNKHLFYWNVCCTVFVCVLTTMSLKLSVFEMLLSVLWISSLWRLISLTFTSWTSLETNSKWPVFV